MPAPLKVIYCVLVMDTDIGYIECLNEDNYVNFLFVVGINTEIVPHNQCFHVTIMEGTESLSGHLCNI